MSTTFERIATAGRAIFVCGLCGARLGLLTCIFTGGTVFHLGIAQHCLIAAAIGFCFAALTIAIGGGDGWRLMGTLGGMGAAVFAFASLLGDNLKRCPDCEKINFVFMMLFALVSCIAGNNLGKRIGDRLDSLPAPEHPLFRIAAFLHDSGIYSMPLAVRLAPAITEAAPVVVALPAILQLLAHQK